MDRLHLWDQLEKLLNEALDCEQARLSSESVSDIRVHIEHGEYRLAWDELMAALSEMNLAPSDSARVAMQQAASLMCRGRA